MASKLKDRLVRPGPALVEGCAEDLDLLAHPAHARAQDDPASREMIEGGEHLGREHGVAVGEHEDGGAEARALGDAGHEAERGQGLEKRRVGRKGKLPGGAIGIARGDGVGHDDVIAGPQAVVAKPLHLTREGQQVRPRGQGPEDGEMAAEFHGEVLVSPDARPRRTRFAHPARRP